MPVDQRARTFDLTDGVGCENCHGPASAWLGPHTTRGWNYDKSLELGMYNTRDLVKRTERCLTCHLGTPEKSVDHELIAAGHPDLYFELDSFMSVMPAHWKEVDKDPWFGVRALAVGQAVQLREQLRRVARESNGGIWPEYAELDCFACHHNLVAAKDSWRQERGYPGRRAGNPPWNPSRYAIFQHVVKEADAAGAQQLDEAVKHAMTVVSDITADRSQIASAATSAAEAADRVAKRITTMQFDQAMTLRLLRAISADGDRIASEGERCAEQAAMALDALYIAYSSNEKPANEQQVRAAINAMFPGFESPSAYSPGPFARQMRTVNGMLR